MANKILQRRRSIPKFPRQDSPKKVRLASSWRAPKGKMGKRKRLSTYKGASPKIGFGTQYRHLASNGMIKIEVANVKELEKINPAKEGIKIKKVGLKKKIDIITQAVQKKIKIFNVRKPEEFIEKNKK